MFAEPPKEDDNFRSIDKNISTRVADIIRARLPDDDDKLKAIPPGDTLEDAHQTTLTRVGHQTVRFTPTGVRNTPYFSYAAAEAGRRGPIC